MDSKDFKGKWKGCADSYEEVAKRLKHHQAHTDRVDDVQVGEIDRDDIG